jgi:hypothetical protein
MMKLTIRTVILTLCVAGASAGAMIPRGSQVVSSTAHPCPHPVCCGTGLVASQK